MMEENVIPQCPSCSKILPAKKVYFCGICMTQILCKSCDTILDNEDLGCTNCGTPRVEKKSSVSIENLNTNTFKLHETLSDRTIEASFSDVVGKDLAGILRDFSLNTKAKSIGVSDISAQNNGEFKRVEETIDADFSISDESSNVEQDSKKIKSSEMQDDEYPSLIAIAMKNLPSSETEWVVVYSFYMSNFGEKIFTREDIIEGYVQANKFNKITTKRDLSKNIQRNVVSGHINPLPEGYSILPSGILKAKEIISRTASSPPKTKSNPSKQITPSPDEKESLSKKRSGKKTLKRLANLDFEPQNKESLKEYFGKFNPKNDFERNLLFVNYLQNFLEINEITYDHIFSCYDLLELRVSENLPQTVRNTASEKGWIETKSGKVSLTIKGKNLIRDWQQK